MKRFFLMISTVAILSSCASNEVDLNQIAPINPDQTNIQANKDNKNGLLFNSFKVRMDFAESTIDGKKYSYALPAIVVSKNLNEGLFGYLTIKMPSKEVGGYLVAGKDGKVYMEPYNPNKGASAYSFNDTLTCYDVGSWSKKGALDPSKLERINFEPNKAYKYEAELHLNPMTHEYLTLTSDKVINPVTKKRGDMVAIAK